MIELKNVSHSAAGNLMAMEEDEKERFIKVSCHKQDVILMVQKKNCCRTTVSMLLSERHDPNFLPEEPLSFFAFPTSPIPSPILSMFSFVPLSCLSPSYFFLIFLIPSLSGAVCVPPHPTAVFIIPAFACIPSRDSFALFGEAKENRNIPPPHTHKHRWPRWITQLSNRTKQCKA